MGQYYRACIIKEMPDKKYGGSNYQMSLYKSYDYGNGSKLMEHSYIGNEYADMVTAQLMKRGTFRFAHIGDYSTEDDIADLDLGDFREPAIEARYIAWSYFDTQLIKRPSSVPSLKGRDLYANNLDKQESVSFLKQPGDPNWDDTRINPLFMLCALGNGRGGGDFHKGTGLEDIGKWAFDRISITEGGPAYKEPGYIFKEEEY